MKFRLSAFGLVFLTMVAACGDNNSSKNVEKHQFAYAANINDKTISVYTINQTTGALTAGPAATSETGPRSVTVSPSGRFA